MVLRPKTTEQVSKILSYCNDKRLALVPQGGNTGLVGGSVPVFDEIILSLSRMNNVISFDENSAVLIAEAGCVLESLMNFLDTKGFIMPLDLGAKGSCQIGGNVATNAGGTRFIRYGSLRGTVLGLETVLADGTILDNLTTMRKDNTGYDIKQLFIGSEGTLGVITKVAILTHRKPKSVQVAFFALDSYAKVLEVVKKTRNDLAEIISAIEFLDRKSMELVLQHIPGTRDPIQTKSPLYVLIETAGSDASHDLEKVEKFINGCMEQSLVIDGTLAQDEAQVKAIWRLRECISESLTKHGAVYKYDISVPLNSMYAFVEDMQKRLAGKALVVGYGHLGDGNLHLNVSAPKYDDALFQLIEPYLLQQTAYHKGSVSAEHGLGIAKADYIHFSKSTPSVEIMKRMKSMLDPNAILNPYKMFPSHAIDLASTVPPSISAST